MDLQTLILHIKGDSSGAESALGKVQGATSKFGGVVKAVIAGAAVAAVVAFGKSCINAAAESQSAEVLLRSSLGNIKGMTDKAKDSAVDWVNKMESAKSFDDAEIGAALQRLTLKTGSLKDAQDMTNTAMEVARNKNISLEAATTLVDGAYNGMTRTLKMFGVEVGPDGKALTGMAAIDAVQAKVKGSGDAWSKTLEGQKAAMATTWGNFQETIGNVLMPLATQLMEIVMPLLTKAGEWVAAHLPQIQGVMKAVMDGIDWVIETAGKMYETIKPFVVSVTETLGPYIKELFAWLTGSEGGDKLQKVLVGVATVIGLAFDGLGIVIKGIVDSIDWVIKKAQEAIAWVKGVAANTGVNQGGVYVAPTTVKPHAEGGWVGLNGPEIALVGEQGPEKIIPAGQSTGNDRAILNRLDDLILAVTRVAPGVGNVINGLGRGL